MTPYAVEPTLRGIWGTSASDIFAVGDRGCIYHYDGLEWTRMESGATANLNGVWGFAGDDVYAVGAGGVILHYDGLEWSPMTSPTTKDMRGVWGSSTSDVFAAGASGTIIHYDGVAWGSMSYSLGGEIYGIHGTSGTNVYAAGEYGYGAMMLHYDGVAWTRNLRSGFWYRSIWISPDGEIFMGGFYGAIGTGAVFHDAGEGVEVIPIDAKEIGWGVWGSSSSDVYVALDQGSIAHYDGSTWSVSRISTNGLYAVWGASGSDIWVTGRRLAVRHFDGAGWVPQMQQDYDIYVQHLDGAGARLWLDEGAPLTVNMDDQAQKTLALDRDGSAVFAWMDGRSGDWNILSRKISIPRGPTVETELLAFGAEPAGTGIRIAWELSRFDEGARFDIARKVDPERAIWNAISPAVERKGFAFSFNDSGLKPGAGYKYRVAVSDTKGERLLFETETISVPMPPLTLNQNYPNPFNPMTAIQYSLPEKCRVALSIYDVSGKLVARLVNTEQDAGIHRVEWNGKDAHGKQAASGIYFYRLTAGKSTLSRKMVLLR